MSDSFVFPAQAPISLPIQGLESRFPVHRIFCVGRNYQAHAAEMGDQIDKTTAEPFYFMKDRSALVEAGSTLLYPPETEDYHYEMEWVLAIGRAGHRITEELAEQHIFGYACGLDMTRRDLQQKGKDKRRPWDLGKNFEQSAVIGPIVAVADRGVMTEGQISLHVNGELRQQGNLNQLIWNANEIIEHLSRFYTLLPGDLIFTGTPEGVGPVKPGDQLEGQIEGLGAISVRIID